MRCRSSSPSPSSSAVRKAHDRDGRVAQPSLSSQQSDGTPEAFGVFMRDDEPGTA